MFVSGEIRWFLRGRLPADVAEWFGSSGLSVDEADRVDDYLFLPGCTTTGIKFRDGRFEVKSNLVPSVPATYPHEVGGLKGAWIKWSREARDARALRNELVSDEDTWVSVRKRRRLRLFSLDNGCVEEVRPGVARLAEGCQIELSSVRCQGEVDWWSLSLESFGTTNGVLENLDDVARHFFRTEPPLRLNQQDSMSYPVWLLTNQESGEK